MRLDEADLQLVRLLQEDARRSFRDLASALGVSTPTAATRVRRLEAMGLIRGYTVRLDERLRGGLVLALRTRPGAADAIADKLRTLMCIEEVLVLAGGLVHARAYPPGPAEARVLHDALSQMEDVASYDAHPILGATAHAGAAAEAAHVDVVCHECGGPIEGKGVRRRMADEREHWFCCRNCAAQFEEKLKRLRMKAKRNR